LDCINKDKFVPIPLLNNDMSKIAIGIFGDVFQDMKMNLFIVKKVFTNLSCVVAYMLSFLVI